MKKSKLSKKDEKNIKELKEIIISIRNDPEAMKEVRKITIPN